MYTKQDLNKSAIPKRCYFILAREGPLCTPPVPTVEPWTGERVEPADCNKWGLCSGGLMQMGICKLPLIVPTVRAFEQRPGSQDRIKDWGFLPVKKELQPPLPAAPYREPEWKAN